MLRQRGRAFFQVACAYDLEGIGDKLASRGYHADGTSTNWFKMKNLDYTHGRSDEVFERRPTSHKGGLMLRVP